MKRLFTFLFYIILFGLFLIFQVFSKNYRDYIITPDSIFHHGEHQHIDSDIRRMIEGNKSVKENNKKELLKEAEKEHHHKLDYLHIRILNHPWNNKKIVQMIFIQALFYLLLSIILIRKVFYE